MKVKFLLITFFIFFLNALYANHQIDLIQNNEKESFVLKEFRFYYFSNVELVDENTDEELIENNEGEISLIDALKISQIFIQNTTPTIYYTINRSNLQPSIFYNHELQIADNEINFEKGIKSTKIARTFSLFIILLLLLFAKLSNTVKFKSYFVNWFNNKDLTNISLEDKTFLEPTSILLFLASLLTINYLLFYTFQYFEVTQFMGFFNFENIFHTMLFTIVLLFIYYILNLFLTIIFQQQKFGFNFRYYTVQSVYVSLIVLFPIVLLIEYSFINLRILFILTLLFLAIIGFIRFIKLFSSLNNQSSFSKLYIIFYLCSLEILPCLLVIKKFS